MATSKDFSASVVKGSEETFDTCCTPCSEIAKTREANNFCVECVSYFCEECLLHHNKFPSLRSHQILDGSGQERNENSGLEKSLPTERCAFHHGKLIDMFCVDHDEVCCGACIALKHRACVNVDYLPKIATGTKDSQELKDTLQSLKDVLEKLGQEREKWQMNLKSLDQQKDHLCKEVENYEKQLTEKIKELSKTAKQQICSSVDEHKMAIQSDVDTLDVVITTTSTAVQKFSNKNDAQLFVSLKTSKKSIQDGENFLKDMTASKWKKEFKFTPNTGLYNKLTAIGSVSTNEEIKEYEATLYGKYKVAEKFCEITGASTLEDCTYLLSDYTNSQLIKLNRHFTVEEKIITETLSYSVQKVGPKEVAVFHSNGTVKFVTIENAIKSIATFNANGAVSGGLFNSETQEMFLLKNGHFCKCRKNGDIIKAYTNEDITINMPRQTAVSGDCNTIYFAVEKGLLALNRKGETLWTFTDADLKRAWGVCVLPGDIILVSGIGSNSVFQVDKNGRKIGVLLGPAKIMNQPFALAFDRSSSRLTVCGSSNEIYVFTLSKKC